jgi:aminopeptidase N
MLHTMRQVLGDEQFFGFLRHYAEMKTNEIATASDFWQAYQAAGGDPATIQTKFFDGP